MTEVIKESFETRMKMRDFEARIKKLEKRIEELENRQNANMYNELRKEGTD
mgnify:CR=1 FL=1